MIDKKDENYIYYVVGQNLKRIRKSKNLTIVKFARLCNYSTGFIMNIESPKYYQTFSLGTIYRFALVLNVDINEFFKEIK